MHLSKQEHKKKRKRHKKEGFQLVVMGTSWFMVNVLIVFQLCKKTKCSSTSVKFANHSLNFPTLRHFIFCVIVFRRRHRQDQTSGTEMSQSRDIPIYLTEIALLQHSLRAPSPQRRFAQRGYLQETFNHEKINILQTPAPGVWGRMWDGRGTEECVCVCVYSCTCGDIV